LVLNGRLYRASFAPLLLALAIAGFSLTSRGGSFSSSLAPDAFNGQAAYTELQGLAARFPERQPGSPDDDALAGAIAHTLKNLGGAAGGGFAVSVRHESAATVAGRRTLSTVIARRPGLTGASPIVLLAHRDAAGRGAKAELSGTAVLLQLARVLASSETQRTVIIVSTSAGSSGAEGAAGFAQQPGTPVDAALVLGNLAGTRARTPFVLSYSSGLGQAPAALSGTVSAALAQQVGSSPGATNTLDTLARFALPLSSGEQGPLLAHGIPAVALQISGERPPAANEPVSSQRLENFGRAALSAVYALDGAPDLATPLQTGLPIQHKLLPEWAVRLLVLALLLGPLLVLVDGLARLLRRRRVRSPGSPAAWPAGSSAVSAAGSSAISSLAVTARRSPSTPAVGSPTAPTHAVSSPAGALLWALACALPFLFAVLFTRLLGLLGLLAAPAGLVPAVALPGGARALESMLVPLLVLILAWLAWPALLRRLGLSMLGPGAPGRSDAAGLAACLVLLGIAVLVSAFNPYAALLFVPALHLWLAVIDPRWRPAGAALQRLRALALLVLALLLPALLLAVDAHQLGYGLTSLAHAGVLLLAGGFLGFPAMLMLCLAFGCLAAVTMVALSPPLPLPSPAEAQLPQEMPISVRGPLSYAGPGSLGGTESALRR
jgi:hypothetical protein